MNHRPWDNYQPKPDLTIRLPVEISDIAVGSALAEITTKLMSVPQEFRDMAVLKIETTEFYGDVTVETYIQYRRDETDEERAARKKEEVRQARMAEAHDRRLYEELKAKFEIDA